MYKEGTIIAINGNLYEYGGEENADFTKDLKLHKVYVIDIDDEGNLTHTNSTDYFATEELKNDNVDFTEEQWHRIVEQFIRYDSPTSPKRKSPMQPMTSCSDALLTESPKSTNWQTILPTILTDKGCRKVALF